MLINKKHIIHKIYIIMKELIFVSLLLQEFEVIYILIYRFNFNMFNLMMVSKILRLHYLEGIANDT